MNTAKRIETKGGDFVEDVVNGTLTKLHNAHVMEYGHMLAAWAWKMGGMYVKDSFEALEYMSKHQTIPDEAARYIRAWPGVGAVS